MAQKPACENTTQIAWYQVFFADFTFFEAQNTLLSFPTSYHMLQAKGQKSKQTVLGIRLRFQSQDHFLDQCSKKFPGMLELYSH